MYQKILVPYDSSSFSEKALEHAIYLAGLSGADLLLVNATVLPALVYTYHEAANAAINEAAQTLVGSSAEAVKLLSALVEKIKKKGISASYRHAVGDPADLIIETAEKEQVDLVVMGSKGLRGVAKIKALGSVTRKVAENASCPVLIVH
ncbi:MAG: universal stress protein [Nitrososphaera sp.]|jgi:nucleotide-binding universal stress UspA family protein